MIAFMERIRAIIAERLAAARALIEKPAPATEPVPSPAPPAEPGTDASQNGE